MGKGNRAQTPETEQTTVRVEIGLHAQVKEAKPPSSSIGHVWSTAARLFLALPRNTQLDLLDERLSIPDVTDRMEEPWDLYIALADFLESQPPGLSQDRSHKEQAAFDALARAWEPIKERLGLTPSDLLRQLRDRSRVSCPTKAALDTLIDKHAGGIVDASANDEESAQQSEGGK